MNERSLRTILDLIQADPEILQRMEELGRLHAELNLATDLVSKTAKKAEAASFSGEPQTAHIIAVTQFDRLRQTFSAELESLLAKIEAKYNIPIKDLTETPIPRFGNRLLKNQLRPDVVLPTAYLERSLEMNMPALLGLFPNGWLNRQMEIAQAELEKRRGGPLLLVGNTRVRALEKAHPLAYSIALAERLLSKKYDYDVYDSSLWVPMIAALCDRLAGLRLVKNGIEKVRQLYRSPADEFESRLYELLVAGKAAEMGREVEFLSPVKSSKTPDLRIHDFPVPVVIECKLQNRLSATEHKEAEIFSSISKRLLEENRAISLSIEVKAELKNLNCDDIKQFVQQLSATPQSASCDFPWGRVEANLFPSTVKLDESMRVFSPKFISAICGWNAADWDGIFLNIENAKDLVADHAIQPVSVKWRLYSEIDLRAKSRSVVRLLSEAIQQIPAGEAACVYIGFEDTHRAAIADARTQLVIEQLKGLYHSRRAISLEMIVISRFYPQPMPDGQPDMIESTIPFVENDDTPYAVDMPLLVFVPPEKVDEEMGESSQES
jgi:hypothetical protein